MPSDTELPRYLQLLWGREPAGRRGPRPSRTIEEIGAAAVALADRDGLDAVSMQAVAAELGLTTMSLYRYVDSKDELYAVMVDVAYGPPPAGLTARGTWRVRLERWARSLADVCVAHPWLVMVPTSRPPATPYALAWTDAGVHALARTPLTDAAKLSSLLVVDGYVRGHVRTCLQFGFLPSVGGSGAAAGRQAPAESEGEGYGAEVAHLLDPGRYPDLLAVMPALQDDDDDFFAHELAFGLRLVLDGVAATIDRST